MKPHSTLARRGFLRSAAGALGATFWCDATLDAALDHTRTASKPSELKITDLRIADLPMRPISGSIRTRELPAMARSGMARAGITRSC